MNARTKAFPRIVSLTMAIAMALTMVVSAYAAVQPYNADATAVTGKFLATSSSYTATVVGPTGTPKTKLEMTLYEKGLFGYKKVDSASASAAKMPVNATRPAFPFMGLPPFSPASQPLGGLPDTMFLPGQ